MGAVRLSTPLILPGGLLTLTTRSRLKWSDRRTLTQIYQDIKSAKQPRSTTYVKVVTPVSLGLMVTGMYLLFTGR